MSINMYQATVPATIRMMQSLTRILDKAAEYCAQRKIEESALLNTRLFPNMFPLARQIQIVSDNAKGIAARLVGEPAPSYPDTETTIAELKARLAKTIDYMNSVPAAKYEGAEERKITLTTGDGRKLEFTGRDFLFNNALPNFYFHATTAYDILRHAGLDLAKRDYLGA